MITHYFKLGYRALSKNKYYSFINIFGLTLGMLSALIIAKYIGSSYQLDNFQENRRRIFVVTQEETVNGNTQQTNTSYWDAGTMATQYPEVGEMTRYSWHIGSLVLTQDKDRNVSFTENRIFSADSSFFKVFSFPLIHGDAQTALSRAHSIVLTRAASRKYFGNENPIGKALLIRVPWGQETTYEVTGVTEDIPENSRFQFDFLVAQSPPEPAESWLVPGYATYLLLTKTDQATTIGEKLTDALKEEAQLKEADKKVKITLEPFTKVQLPATAVLLVVTGIFIVIISWANYINQVIAQSYMRIKETGVLRVIGASSGNLKTQFIVESSLLCSTALLLIILIYSGLEPVLQSLTNGHFLPLFNDPTPINFLFLAIFAAGIILAASIPTVILFSQDSGASLRQTYNSKIGGIGLRKGLVAIQFSISAVLMISIFVITNQLSYIRHKDKGINMENTLIVKAPMINAKWDVRRKTMALFKEKCAELPFVSGITSSTTVPAEEYRQETYISFQGKEEKAMVHQNDVDDRFFDFYQVRFAAGHNFIPDARSINRNSIILNESAAKALGIFDFDKAIDTKITDHETEEVYNLIGIVKDYHKTALKYQMRPTAFKFNDLRGHFSLKLNPGTAEGEHLEAAIGAVQGIWNNVYPDASFESYFLKEKFEADNMEDLYLGRLFECFTFLSIIVSCLGLFGLSLLISTKRQKEIGVRKVFGATSMHILTSMIKGYLSPLLVSMAVGAPLAYGLMNRWLMNYAYHTGIGMGTISLALLVLVLIFLFTVSYHTIRSAVANPVTVLRD